MIPIDLSNKKALVTGSSSGLGAQIAKYLAKAGAQVAIHYHKEEKEAQDIANDIMKEQTKVDIFQADISDITQVEKLFKEINEKMGGLDILVNNAGIDGKRVYCVDSDPAEWENVIKINLFGPYYCAKEALKIMIPQKSGVIIQITSVHEFIPWSGYSAYCCSKSALSMLTKTLAQEAADDNIRVISVAPGAIATPINEKVWKNPLGLTDLENKIPMKRVGKSEEVANLVVFLTSDLASYITGTTIPIDGGMLIYPDFRHGG
ncbi:3-oxoacyl-ACP reductase FabG [Desulfurella sp.]|uniref:3-oxoacyl-ACP reductase FabG n=1 Tax=Desulfurella sp. TaxID=1962857 RepID=UPI003D0F2EE7